MNKPGARLFYLSLQSAAEGQAGYTHVNEIVGNLRSLGVEVALYTPRYPGGTRPPVLRRIREILRIQARLWLDVVCRGRHATSLYTRSHFAAWPTALLARLLRIPFLVEVNGPLEDIYIAWPSLRRWRRWLDWLELATLRHADVLIAVTPQLKSWLESIFPAKRIAVVSNGANIDLFRPCTKPADPPYAIFFGALTRWQGIDTILQAVDSPAWPKPVKLMIVGDGAERDRVLTAAGRNDAIHYVGKVPYAEVPAIVAGALVGLSVQNNEGGRSETGLCPLKVYETLACGVPAVVSSFPCQQELVAGNECGLVVPAGDSAAVARSVRYLYENPAARGRMAANGRRTVVEQHSWRHRARAIQLLLAKSVPPCSDLPWAAASGTTNGLDHL